MQPPFFIFESCVGIAWVWIDRSDFHHQTTWNWFPAHFCSCSTVDKKEQVSVGHKSERLGQKLVVILSGSIPMRQLHF